ncbi:FAD assembly factor SdhE [Rickettsiales endosymbiont of Stachyamoeba lipophora]|uniref:FAD assembly factor SdhE n=1 Tax=Rickettsiales endosymbiont of Stachyamoeba lipophora TaxID=2486578 RepID=UPI000F64D820|nr:succinate dehydrogenase assembly factor 2 [Rickettsiales endosymbiont of Stachyamoeba lipophora]AZL15020.1 succinate dehydrogenase assembly factor 2 [Rickettsiales endosymbiont of Stachyamoeba lipophora]
MIDENLYKKLYYRSCHRGCKESDIIFQRFADKHLKTLSGVELQLYIDFLNELDADIMAWIMNQVPFPDKYLLIKTKILSTIDG